ncbi:hypothetical protein Lfu02_17230 [Longispora fulva]|uniref:Putative membrane protein n=1 Tax=Longispora fulva TaxID=619741 RepID=A0A8J7GVG5_9ACTN|nr:hypothetical protein [Longispora fulva]MBG6140270.1 putative membrane protein [Longispora fulva]GIG57351.1 hypothetical protein Lfu02_17230 [Longispora fulva]
MEPEFVWGMAMVMPYFCLFVLVVALVILIVVAATTGPRRVKVERSKVTWHNPSGPVPPDAEGR